MSDDATEHEATLHAIARRLGAAAAERLEVERTAQAVLARLRAGDAPARGSIRWMQPAWMRAAAVVVVLIGAGLLIYRQVHQNTGRSAQQEVAMATVPATGEVEDFTSGQLQDVLASLDEPVETTPVVHAGEAGVEDLSASQLVSLLKAMED